VAFIAIYGIHQFPFYQVNLINMVVNPIFERMKEAPTMGRDGFLINKQAPGVGGRELMDFNAAVAGNFQDIGGDPGKISQGAYDLGY